MRRILYFFVLFAALSINTTFLHTAETPPVSPAAPAPASVAPTAAVVAEKPLLPAIKDGESPIAINVHGEGTLELDIVDPKFIGYRKNTAFDVHKETKDGHAELKLMVKKSAHAHAASIRLDGELYTLLQFHFHAPSEHHINGKQYDLEAHFVHANKAGELAVVGLVFAVGIHNEGIEQVINLVKNRKKKKHPKILALADLVPLADTRVFRYYGSLTTPPFTKNVKWQVMRTTAEISKEQLEAMRTLSMLNGARDVQPLNKRTVLVDSTHSK